LLVGLQSPHDVPARHPLLGSGRLFLIRQLLNPRVDGK
jgi:hypothetical protein